MPKEHKTFRKMPPRTPEHQAKINAGSKGRTRTPEQRARITAGLKARWAAMSPEKQQQERDRINSIRMAYQASPTCKPGPKPKQK